MQPSSPVVAKPSFCSGISASGDVFQKEGQLSPDFLGITKDCAIVWIDTPVADVRGQAGSLAAILGFDPSVVSVLLEGYYAAYEDRTTELGLILPAIKIEKFHVEPYP